MTFIYFVLIPSMVAATFFWALIRINHQNHVRRMPYTREMFWQDLQDGKI
jgi:hypothetical protein